MSKKKEYCLNCGNETHCGEILKRTEKGYASEGSRNMKLLCAITVDVAQQRI